jgi:hypothetical protein
VDIKVDVFRVTDAFPEETEIGPAFKAIELLLYAGAKLGQEEQVKAFNRLNIPQMIHNR